MKVGDTIKVVWTDGLELIGRFIKTERGYVILKDKSGKEIICNPNAVSFEILEEQPPGIETVEENSYCSACECDPCDCGWGNY